MTSDITIREEDLRLIEKRSLKALHILNTFLEETSDLEEDCSEEEKIIRINREIQVVFQTAAQFSAKALVTISRYIDHGESLIDIHESFIALVDSYMAELEEQEDMRCEKRKRKGKK